MGTGVRAADVLTVAIGWFILLSRLEITVMRFYFFCNRSSPGRIVHPATPIVV
jgi:hypothetical protein